MADPRTEEAPYRVSSKAPEGMRIEPMADGGVRVIVGDDTFPLDVALNEGWVDTAPVVRNRRKKADEPVAPQGIYAALVAVLKELPAIGKNARNDAQRFNYRSIDEVLDHLNPLLGTHGVFYTPRVVERIGEQRTTKNNNALWTVHLHVEYTFYALDGSSVTASAWGEGTDSGDKATSKAMTMAQKSCLMQVLAISDHEVGDPDGTTQEESNAAPQPPADSMSDEDRAGFKRDIATMADNQRTLLKKMWTQASIPPLDHPYLRESHAEAIVTLMNQALAVPPESAPDEATQQA